MKEEKVDKIIQEYISDLDFLEPAKEQIFLELETGDSVPKKVELIKVNCIRCNHSWYIRRNRFPKVCASCTSEYWNKPRERELGFEYFGRRVYGFCARCGTMLSHNGTRTNRLKETIRRFKCSNCGLQSQLKLTATKTTGKRCGRKSLSLQRIILVDVPGLIREYTMLVKEGG